MGLIDKDKLPEQKFADVENMHIVIGRQAGKTIIQQAINNAYKIGWNAAIEAIVENAPVVEDTEPIRCKDCKYQKTFWHEDKRMKAGGYWIYHCDFIEDSFVGVPVWGSPEQFCSSAEKRKDG